MGQGAESCRGYDVEYDEYEENLTSGLWVQRDGAEIAVSDMQTRHIKNALRMVRGLARSACFTSEVETWLAWADIFEEELARRGSAKTAQAARGAKVQMVCHCGAHYETREADLKRGWGLSCSKRCASIRREFGRPAAKRKGEQNV